ncbi:hypothetical protein SAMN05660991_01423 [Trujillonella endophytica]|uniref:Uncharacterized protein n=1 Tax=Trujillonella endophytica TaxID=673521 RepID=A0A1H8RY86_9ACTN|nr:hypothetical protein SAMN05660991_01423 [Trujillella endophytica]
MDLSGIDLTTEVVRTERLDLRPYRTADVDAVLTACQDPERPSGRAERSRSVTVSVTERLRS